MSKVRVHELAKEFGTTSQAILKLLASRGFFVKSASSQVDRYAVEWLRFEFTVNQPPPVPSRPRTAPQRHLRRPERSRGEGFPGSGWRAPSPFPSGLGRRRPAGATRTVRAFGARRSEMASLDLASVEAGLIGSPYSLPSEQVEYLTTDFLLRSAALTIRAQREMRRISSARKTTLRRITRSSEVYESNQIENLGPDLATTHRVLAEHQLDTQADVSLAQQAIERALGSEPKIREVVGLGAARLLAEVYCSDRGRRITESDLRNLHWLVMVGDPQRGKYKGYLNEIEGSDHTPAAPSDTPAAMADMVEWLATTTMPTLWRAAVAHAWVTHIHPFHDGNGRIARLLANLILIRDGMPPLVIRAAGDRGAYIDALAASDAGGDILPLARVFRDVLSRAVQDLADPELADQLFDAAVAQRSAPRQVRWNRMLNEFLSELAPHLLLHRLNLDYIGAVTDAELTRIGVGRPENAWIAKITASNGERDLLLHVAAPSSLNRTYMEASQITPSIFVSVRNPRPLDARPYLPVGQEMFTYEFTPLVDSDEILVRRGQERTRFPVHEAASQAAEHLARTFQQLIGRPR